MKSETTEKYAESLLQKATEAVLKSMPEKLEVSAPFNITRPDPRFGDYASNIALVLAKVLKKKPQDLAGQIIAELKQLDAEKRFAEIEPAGGFINFKVSGA